MISVLLFLFILICLAHMFSSHENFDVKEKKSIDALQINGLDEYGNVIISQYINYIEDVNAKIIQLLSTIESNGKDQSEIEMAISKLTFLIQKKNNYLKRLPYFLQLSPTKDKELIEQIYDNINQYDKTNEKTVLTLKNIIKNVRDTAVNKFSIDVPSGDLNGYHRLFTNIDNVSTKINNLISIIRNSTVPTVSSTNVNPIGLPITDNVLQPSDKKDDVFIEDDDDLPLSL